jgi:hypothetical protein
VIRPREEVVMIGGPAVSGTGLATVKANKINKPCRSVKVFPGAEPLHFPTSRGALRDDR